VNPDLEEMSAAGAEQARGEDSREPNKINAATKYSFTRRNLTAYGGLPSVAAMLQTVDLRELAGETVNLELKRLTRAMQPSGFLLGMILAVYVGFSPLNHLHLNYAHFAQQASNNVTDPRFGQLNPAQNNQTRQVVLVMKILF
jgi:hypothetical protein